MNNLIKADLYRTRKSLIIYIIPVFLVFSSFISTLLSSNITPNSVHDNIVSVVRNGIQVDILSFLLMSVFIIVSGLEFNSGTIKNSLASGIGRGEVYFSKYILSCIYTIIYCAISFVSYIVFSALFLELSINGESIKELLFMFIKVLPIYLSLITAGQAFVFITQSGTVSVLIYVMSLVVLNSLATFTVELQEESQLLLLLPITQIAELTKIDIPIKNYLIIYSCVILSIIMFNFIGYKIFTKSEIK